MSCSDLAPFVVCRAQELDSMHSILSLPHCQDPIILFTQATALIENRSPLPYSVLLAAGFARLLLPDLPTAASSGGRHHSIVCTHHRSLRNEQVASATFSLPYGVHPRPQEVQEIYFEAGYQQGGRHAANRSALVPRQWRTNAHECLLPVAKPGKVGEDGQLTAGTPLTLTKDP